MTYHLQTDNHAICLMACCALLLREGRAGTQRGALLRTSMSGSRFTIQPLQFELATFQLAASALFQRAIKTVLLRSFDVRQVEFGICC